MKTFFLGICLLALCAIGRAQALRIGDRVPDVYLAHIINDQRSQGSLRSFQKKLTILDFWGTGCSACIAAFPDLDALQRQFPGALQILAVSRETTDSVQRFLKRHPKIRLPALPFVTGDTTLAALFPHVLMPHQVWIDSAGVVRYITDGYNATSQHVMAFLKGDALQLTEKKFVARTYTNLWDVFHGSGSDSLLAAYSLLSHPIPGVVISNALRPAREGGPLNRISMGTVTILNLYQRAYEANGQHDFLPSTIEIRCKDSARLRPPTDLNQMDAWVQANMYLYERMVPEGDAAHIYERMQKDLGEYFGIHARIDTQWRPCFVLTLSADHDKLVSKKKILRTNLWSDTGGDTKFAEAYPMEGFVQFLKGHLEQAAGLPFIDETNFRGRIDISFSKTVVEAEASNAWQAVLRRYGLKLDQQPRKVAVLILE